MAPKKPVSRNSTQRIVEFIEVCLAEGATLQQVASALASLNLHRNVVQRALRQASRSWADREIQELTELTWELSQSSLVPPSRAWIAFRGAGRSLSTVYRDLINRPRIGQVVAAVAIFALAFLTVMAMPSSRNGLTQKQASSSRPNAPKATHRARSTAPASSLAREQPQSNEDRRKSQHESGSISRTPIQRAEVTRLWSRS